MIPEAAVEAAARAHQELFAGLGHEGWDDLWQVARDRRLAWMRAALEAAAPHMAAQVLKDAVEAFPLETITAPDNAVVWLMRRAEQIRNEA